MSPGHKGVIVGPLQASLLSGHLTKFPGNQDAWPDLDIEGEDWPALENATVIGPVPVPT